MSKVQAVILNKKYFDRNKSIKWIKDNGFKLKKIHETGNSFRFRQHNPNKFEKFRTVSPKRGISFVIGFN